MGDHAPRWRDVILTRGRQEGFTTKNTKDAKEGCGAERRQNDFVSFVSFVVQAFVFPLRTVSAQ
jgi:hypothetical protein